MKERSHLMVNLQKIRGHILQSLNNLPGQTYLAWIQLIESQQSYKLIIIAP
jgi:hypothetical protein